MIKIIPSSGPDVFGEAAASLIKIASSGLRGNDLNDFVKRAGNEIARQVKNITAKPGEVLTHLIAMSSAESNGPNRNFDGFSEKALRNDHPTFKKYGRFYRDHQNKDTKKSYGIIKESFYNEEMRRVELIVALNGTKEAAERNGGLVADRELEKLASGQDMDVSMSSKVPFDSCVGCHNKAKSRREYCLGIEEGGHCKYGGLKNNIGKVSEDGLILYADNPINKFFDISKVTRHADRSAFLTGKIASDNKIISGAELAEILQVSAPPELLVDDAVDSNIILDRIKIARDLSYREPFIKASDFDRAFDPHIYSSPDFSSIESGREGVALYALAKEKIALSFPDWLSLTTGADHTKCAAASVLTSPALKFAHRALLDDEDIPTIIRSTKLPECIVSYNLSKWAEKQAENSSLSAEYVRQRIWRSALNSLTPFTYAEKQASCPDNAVSLAKSYAAYQVNFLALHEGDRDFDLMQDLILRQNRIIS